MPTEPFWERNKTGIYLAALLVAFGGIAYWVIQSDDGVVEPYEGRILSFDNESGQAVKVVVTSASSPEPVCVEQLDDGEGFHCPAGRFGSATYRVGFVLDPGADMADDLTVKSRCVHWRIERLVYHRDESAPCPTIEGKGLA